MFLNDFDQSHLAENDGEYFSDLELGGTFEADKW